MCSVCFVIEACDADFIRHAEAVLLAGRVFTSLEQAQAELDAWVAHYITERAHQGIGMVPPISRFALAATRSA